MTNEELKKKIINLLDEATGSWYEDEDGMFAEGYSAEEGDNRFKAHVADALIAAGIGDVKEEKFEADHYWNMWQGALVELERAERRVKVAERALKVAADLGELCAPAEDYIEQAEKELQEEGKE